ncbi:MAG TPA: arylamine N-acetyltransferase [Casimicrobiaceae bacterium]|jgi:N-hydroxyarylamine O-acetyltransferase|nr:arylamine N-acetyltransferase [Casimicrobiaceae bacterium]
MSLDLDAYFERIQWGGGTRPTYDTLAGILDAHMRHIPFENLDVLLGRPIRLDIEGLQAKLVNARRGGYCFEQATLLGAALGELGFAFTAHTARVVLFAPRSASARTHMFLNVTLDDRAFVVDPGFGALAPRVPVPLVDGTTVTRGPDAHVMTRDGGYWVLRAKADPGMIDAWVTTLDLDNAIDFEMGNHFTATWPGSAFVSRIMLRAFGEDLRVTVMNRDVTVRRGDATETRQLADRSELRALLARDFGFDLPEVEALRVPSIPEWS